MMQKILKSLSLIRTQTWLVTVAAFSTIERAILYVFYRPVSYNDTASYRRMADAIMSGWKQVDGTRTPGYPIFLGIIGPDERVYLVQLILGLATTMLFFYVAWRISGKPWFGATAAMAHTLNLGQLFFESDLLSESLTTFFFTVTLACLAWLFFTESNRPTWKTAVVASASGLFAGMAALTRPLFVFMPVWVALFLFAFWRRATLKMRWTAVVTSGLAGLLIVGAWANFLNQRFGVWSLSTMTGYHLVQHTGLFFEYVPDKYAAIRDTYIQYRQERIARTGEPGNAIWDAIPALEQVSGLSFVALSNLLANISIRLILQHPLLYLHNVLLGWLWFWKVPVYWSAVSVTNQVLRGTINTLITLERGGIFIFNIGFILGSLSLFWKKARRTLMMNPFLWFAVSSIWFTSILQTLLDHGDNPRFSVPIQTWVVFIVLSWILSLINRKKYENIPA